MKRILVINLILLFSFCATILSDVTEKDMRYVMSPATSFSAKTNGPLPHYKAFQGKDLIGICYLSTDITPEIIGYNGPIMLLIGLYKNGTISGIKVIHHIENIEEAFDIEESSFDRQFSGKNITNSFTVDKDIDNITGATVTVEKICEMVKKSSTMMFQYYFGKHRSMVKLPQISPSQKSMIEKSLTEEKIILKPKWKVKKADEKLIKNQMKSGNLSDKEADNYQKITNRK